MATTRRSFFGWLAGAAAVVPALPAIAEAAAKAPVRRVHRVMLRTKLPDTRWLSIYDKEALQGAPVLNFRGIPIRMTYVVLTNDIH
jgi:hypothetical protein